MKDTRLNEIFFASEDIMKKHISNVNKIKQLYYLMQEASQETWKGEEEYKKQANDLYLYVQSLWNRIYLENLESKEKEEIDNFIFSETTIRIY